MIASYNNVEREKEHDDGDGNDPTLDPNNNRLVDIPLFLVRKPSEPARFVHPDYNDSPFVLDHPDYNKSSFVLDSPSEPLREFLKPGGDSGVVQQPSSHVEAVIASKRLPGDPPDQHVETIRSVTIYDAKKKTSFERVTKRKWDGFIRQWYIFTEEIEDLNSPVYETDNRKGRTSQSITLEGWMAFEGKHLVELSHEKILDLCPYERGTMEASEWFEGWWNGAKWFWQNEVNKPEKSTVTVIEPETLVL